MEIVRFGVGHRRPEGPKGSRNVSGQVVFSDPRGLISELAFARHAVMEPHSNPHATWFLVIEGGGFVSVGEEQSRVAAGEAVHWPPGVVHAAWTDQSQMRAIVVEFATDDPTPRLIANGGSRERAPIPPQGAARGDGKLADGSRHGRYDPTEGEPF